MLKLLIVSLILSGCSTVKPARVSFQWEFLEYPPDRPMACLPEQDVIKLREVLIRCGELSAD